MEKLIRNNLLSLFKREGYCQVPVYMELCPYLEEIFVREIGEENYWDYFKVPISGIADPTVKAADPNEFRKYYDSRLPENISPNGFGIAHLPGSEAAKHMTQMLHPLQGDISLEQLKEYPFPVISSADEENGIDNIIQSVNRAHDRDRVSCANMECTIWELSWYIRSMEDLMADMMEESERAEYLLDVVTEYACSRAYLYAKAGADMLALGDDIGMQHSIMMSVPMWETWIKPRLAKVIKTARSINPEILIMYHSCGYITPFIEGLIETGIDILNPVQPECMDFKEIHAEFGDRLSFRGTIGTQTTMPFGTPEDVKREVFRNLDIAGPKGGLLCSPSHLLEPEVPWENVLAYIEACNNYLR